MTDMTDTRDQRRCRTIVLLSHKRSGTTAMFKVFQSHPDVGVCHVDQSIGNWEPNFWNLAAAGIAGDTSPFVMRFKTSHPFLDIPERFTERTVFQMWDRILREQGPVVFDKSPQYLGNRAAVGLLLKYRDSGNDVRIFALIRDPRDVITSQYGVLGRGAHRHRSSKELEQLISEYPHLRDDSPEKRERHWLDKHRHLEELLSKSDNIPVFRYEDVASAPICYMPMIFRHCSVRDIPQAYARFHPTNVGRYSASPLPEIRRWKPGAELQAILNRYGYGRQVRLKKDLKGTARDIARRWLPKPLLNAIYKLRKS